MAVTAIKKDTAKSKEAEPAAAVQAPKKKKLWLLLIVGVLVLAAIGGGAYWYFVHAAGKGEATAEPVKPPLFIPLETFTVNLQIEDAPQFLQVGLSLRVADAAVGENLKVHMPEIRDSILMLLSSRKPSELLALEGKRKLSTDIVDTVNGILVPREAAVAAPKAKAPAPAPAEAEAAAPAEEPASDAAESDTPPVAKPAPKKPAKAEPPVRSVLFTAFIIQ